MTQEASHIKCSNEMALEKNKVDKNSLWLEQIQLRPESKHNESKCHSFIK